MKNTSIFKVLLFSSATLLIFAGLALIQFRQSISSLKSKEKNLNHIISKIAAVSQFPISYIDMMAVREILDSADSKSVYAIRIGNQFCDKCIDDLIVSLVDTFSLKNETSIWLLASVDIPNDILRYYNRFNKRFAVKRVSYDFSPLDKFNQPYVVRIDRTLTLTDPHVYSLYNADVKSLAKRLLEREIYLDDISLTFFKTKIKEIPLVKLGDRVSVAFEYQNNTNSNIEILDIQTKCGCTIADWNKGIIRPNEKGKIIFEINPYKSGTFYRECEVYTSNDKKPIKLVIQTSAK